MHIITCQETQHADAMLAIINDAIVNTTALYDYRPRTRASMTAWFAAKARGSFPVIGLQTDSGELAGFASYGTFRAWPAYRYSVEHSIYLLQALITAAGQQGVHVLIGGIDTDNQASIRLHERAGFHPSRTLHQVAYKFGRWLDLAFYQLTLSTPAQPEETEAPLPPPDKR
ncbi:GNAT family N-acetyltransferase [Sodalis praecaptivus]|uniref:GNAT family N-acetyltransferase n=1 Tax=Sodalis praecaptivus TaxID=1239307 RepID=UPI0027FA87B4|nr:N-acetyltransferase family protein [Sodalis praecaptivus]CAJ0998163.1 L-methionine sulfoximine/L-methionine sulfone acetyltransferase [Sodalis praecaptivus]